MTDRPTNTLVAEPKGPTLSHAYPAPVPLTVRLRFIIMQGYTNYPDMWESY